MVITTRCLYRQASMLYSNVFMFECSDIVYKVMMLEITMAVYDVDPEQAYIVSHYKSVVF